MQQHQQQQGNSGALPKTGLAWLVVISRALAHTVEVFLRRDFGERYAGRHVLAVIPVMLAYGAFWPHANLDAFVCFMGLYLLMCLARRAEILRRRKHGGPQPHSYYSGRPRLMRFFKRSKEVSIKGGAEPLLVMLTGMFLLPLDEPLGSYLMLAGIGLMVSVQLAVTAERTHAMDMHDAVVEARQRAQSFREMGGEH